MLAVTPQTCEVSSGRRDSNTHLRSGAPVPLLLGHVRTRCTTGTEPAHRRYGGTPLFHSRRFKACPSRSWDAVGARSRTAGAAVLQAPLSSEITEPLRPA